MPRYVIGLLALTVLALPFVTDARQAKPLPGPAAKTVTLNPTGRDYTSIVAGPPESVSMESGYVVTMPGQSGGRHSTKNYEEVLVVLAGTGEMRLTAGKALLLRPYVAAYCPPRTEHDVVNTGKEPLRYVYVAAKAQWIVLGRARRQPLERHASRLRVDNVAPPLTAPPARDAGQSGRREPSARSPLPFWQHSQEEPRTRPDPPALTSSAA